MFDDRHLKFNSKTSLDLNGGDSHCDVRMFFGVLGVLSSFLNLTCFVLSLSEFNTQTPSTLTLSSRDILVFNQPEHVCLRTVGETHSAQKESQTSVLSTKPP